MVVLAVMSIKTLETNLIKHLQISIPVFALGTMRLIKQENIITTLQNGLWI